MGDPQVVFVMLRQPRRDNPAEMRTDPFWEFGSFGCTRCHSRNLMNPRKVHELSGNLLAFAQGGDAEVRLVLVTPPVAMVHHGLFAEATWHPAEMPLAYRSAPVLVDNHGGSDVPALIEMIDGVRRNTPIARFASKFRSRRRPLPADIGRQVVAVYRDCRDCARRSPGTVRIRCHSRRLGSQPEFRLMSHGTRRVWVGRSTRPPASRPGPTVLSRHNPWGDPCGRPDSRRAHVGWIATRRVDSGTEPPTVQPHSALAVLAAPRRHANTDRCRR